MTAYNIYGYEVKAEANLCGAKANEDTTWSRWFNPEVAETMVREAGFSRFDLHDFDDPGNLYYEVRP